MENKDYPWRLRSVGRYRIWLVGHLVAAIGRAIVDATADFRDEWRHQVDSLAIRRSFYRWHTQRPAPTNRCSIPNCPDCRDRDKSLPIMPRIDKRPLQSDVTRIVSDITDAYNDGRLTIGIDPAGSLYVDREHKDDPA